MDMRLDIMCFLHLSRPRWVVVSSGHEQVGHGVLSRRGRSGRIDRRGRGDIERRGDGGGR
jgi:hypothetical protein